MLQTIENVTQGAVAGLLTGSIYGLRCVGLALIFGVMRVFNFAQGDFMMLGMYAADYAAGLLGLEALCGRLGGPYVGILLAVPLLYLFGYLVHALLISRVSGTPASMTTLRSKPSARVIASARPASVVAFEMPTLDPRLAGLTNTG